MTASGLATAGTNLLLAMMYCAFAYSHLLSFLAHRRASVALVVVMEALFAFFILVRMPAERSSLRAWDWTTTICGTFAPLLLRPSGAPRDLVAGQILQILGAGLAVGGVLSLNRSIGLVPARRAIRTDGLYRFVRHPLYAAYTIGNLGYLVSNFTATNLVLVSTALVFQVLRIFNEEHFLLHYAAYGEYRQRTRWRLLPYVF